MKNIHINLINDKLKRYNIYLLIWTFIFIIAVCFGIIGYLETEKKIKFTYLNEVILMENDSNLKNAYLDVHQKPYVFAEYDNESTKFYIVQDDNYMYIVFLTEELYNIIMDTDLEKKPYRIEGYTETIPQDVRVLAIDAYNEVINEEVINGTNFESYFGTVYLNTTGIYNNTLGWYFLAIAFGVIGILGFSFVNRYKRKSKIILANMTFNDLKKLDKELSKEDITIFVKNLYLTTSYIVTLQSYIDIIKYKEILWIYKQEHRLGIKTYQSIIVVTKDKEKHILVSLHLNKKTNSFIEEILNALIIKVPKVLIGYTEDNKIKVNKGYTK